MVDPGVTMSEANVETVQGIYEAFGRGDVPAILGALAEDVIWDHDTPSWGLPWYEPRTGRNGVGEFFGALAAGLVIHSMEPTNVLVGANLVGVVLKISVEVMGTGIVDDDIEIHLWTFDDAGQVCRFAHVVDRHPMVARFRGQTP